MYDGLMQPYGNGERCVTPAQAVGEYFHQSYPGRLESLGMCLKIGSIVELSAILCNDHNL